MENEFSTLDIVKALKIPRERLRDWMNRSFIEPSVSADGQGTKAIFTLHDVYSVALFQALINSGFNRETSSRFVKYYMEQEKKKKEIKIKKNARIFPEPDYILIRIPEDRKEFTHIMDLTAYVDKRYSPNINLESGLPETEASKAFRARPDADEIFAEMERKRTRGMEINTKWSILHIVNYKAIRDKVDEALKEL
jgi:hypothetical protein